MAKNGSIQESIKVESMEPYIVETLLKGANVIIPDIGHLELKSLGDRRTVLFKPTEDSDAFLRVMSATGSKEKNDTDSLYSLLTIPLKGGQIVNLPKVGVFRPTKRENGDTHISFILSSYLRKRLNGEEEKVEEAKVAEVKEIKSEEVQGAINKTEEVLNIQKDENGTPKSELVTSKTEITGNSRRTESLRAEQQKNNERKIQQKSNLTDTQKNVPFNKEAVRQNNGSHKTPWWRTIGGILLILAIVIFLVVLLFTTISGRGKGNKNIEDDKRLEVIVPTESVSLPSLAEQHYGHSAFWIYIYEANRDKLKSPINIPKNVTLVIPDLKSEYDVDLTDSMEIKKANILADIVLKENITRNINK
jgi:nucleoid-associated protein YgaU